MSIPIVLASGSAIRREMLENARIDVEVNLARVDEESLKASLLSEGAIPRDIADVLAEAKAQKVSRACPGALVIGCDQVLDFDGRLLSKAETQEELFKQLQTLCGKIHDLWSAAVIYENGRPVWRHVGHARLTMVTASDVYLRDYIDRNWTEIQHCVGGYQLEREGVRLFSNVQGDFFHVLGMPLLEILGYLARRGVIDV